MHDPTEPDRYEILDGPGQRRRARSKPSDKKKIAVIAASALVAALAVVP